MRNKKIRRLLIKSFKTAGADKIITSYILFFFAIAVPIWLIEPNIGSYADSLWFCFASSTSIGYGDLCAVTLFGRLMTVVLTVYSIAVIAIFTAVVTSFFMDLAKLKSNESVQSFLDDLERLPELSKEELAELSKKVKEFHKEFNNKKK